MLNENSLLIKSRNRYYSCLLAYLNMLLETNIDTLIQLMITVLIDDPIICDLPIKVIRIYDGTSLTADTIPSYHHSLNLHTC